MLLILTPRLDRDAQSADWVRAVEAHGGWVQVWPVDAGKFSAWLRARFDVFKLGECALSGDTARTLRMLDGLRAEGIEPTLVLWSLSKSVRDLWGTLMSGPGGPARAWPRQSAALDQGKRRAPKLSFARLTVRAVRADRMIKGRLAGDAWDEMALLAADLCAQRTFALPRSPLA